jgi:hypothetical protein
LQPFPILSLCCRTPRSIPIEPVAPAGDRLSPKENPENPFAESTIPGHMIRKGGEIPMKTRKKKVLTEHAKRQEASFWKMMKAADSGRQCFS